LLLSVTDVRARVETMKGPKFLYLLFAAAVIALLAWYLHRSERGSWQEQAVPAGEKILGQFPVNDVTSVTLSGPDGRVTLQRSESGWVVSERSDYPADFERLSALILKLSNLEAVQSIPVAEADRGALSLRSGADDIPREETGTQVELRGAGDQPLAALLLGKMHTTTPQGMRPEIGGTASGRYVMPVAGGGNAYLVSETFSDLQTAPSAWIDKTFIRPGMPRRVEAKSKDTSWVLKRDVSGGQWTMDGLRKNQSLDMNKAMAIDSMFTGMAVADVPDGPDDARVKPLETDPVTVVAETFDGLRYVLTIGRGDGDNLPVKVSVEALPEELTNEEAKKARDEKLSAAAKFQDKTVFIPRNFVAPFLSPRAEWLAAPGNR
jgi:hypothetical protein